VKLRKLVTVGMDTVLHSRRLRRRWVPPWPWSTCSCENERLGVRVKLREEPFIVVTVSQESGFQDAVFPEVFAAFEAAGPAFVNRMYGGVVAYFCVDRGVVPRIEALVRRIEELNGQVRAPWELRVGIACEPVMIESRWFGVIRNIWVPGPTVQQAVDCQKIEGLHRQRLEEVKESVLQTSGATG
jgi:hypothetical protein